MLPVDNRPHHPHQRRAKVAVASAKAQADAVRRLALISFTALAMLGLLFVSMVRAQDVPTTVPDTTISAMQSIITAQIDAFRAEDAEAAYAFAAEPIKMRFPSPSMFVSMVQQGYPAVYAPQSFSFAGAALTPQGPAQQVEFVAQDGQVWRGLYTFSENEDGALLISGVFLRQQNEQQI